MNIKNGRVPLRAAGFTLVEIMVVVAIIGMLISVATVGISQAIKSAKSKTCAINIEAIEGAKSLWMLDAKKGDNDTGTEDDLKGYLKQNAFPTCPSGGTYTINANSVRATCSIHGAGATSSTGTSTPAQ